MTTLRLIEVAEHDHAIARENVPDRSVARASAVLRAFDAQHVELRVSDISRRAGLPKSTTSRLVRELVDYGFLERDGANLRFGIRMFEYGELADRHHRLRATGLPFMADLREATRQTVHLAVLDGVEIVYVEVLSSTGGPRLPSRAGGRLPAHACAVGKALLAFSDESAAKAACSGPLARVGPRTVTAPGMLCRELSRIRSTGLAYESEESGPGIGCVASPVIGDNGLAIAAMSISGWTGKIDMRRMGPTVQAAAAALSRELFGSSRPLPARARRI